MPRTQVSHHLSVWGAELIEPGTIHDALQTTGLIDAGIIWPYVALMPDAHRGIGSTVGSIIPTRGAIIPAAVGVDIGCGMAAVRTSLSAHQLPDNLEPLLGLMEAAVPAGVGRGHNTISQAAERWLSTHHPHSQLTDRQQRIAGEQFGTLGSGNHFFEISLDAADQVWVVLHSGSRGIGNQLASHHIEQAKGVMKQLNIRLQDPNLAYLLENTPEFQAYIADLLWAQAYARANRDQMMTAALAVFFNFVGTGQEQDRVNCHHNYTAREEHFGASLWITRKGAISARAGELGIIPGSMGTDTYIVEGLGNPDAFYSSSHGAGRRLSRSQAKAQLSTAELEQLMGNRVWHASNALGLLDESPQAYKDITAVMAAQVDLVRIRHRLVQIFNHKGHDKRNHA